MVPGLSPLSQLYNSYKTWWSQGFHLYHNFITVIRRDGPRGFHLYLNFITVIRRDGPRAFTSITTL